MDYMGSGRQKEGRRVGRGEADSGPHKQETRNSLRGRGLEKLILNGNKTFIKQFQMHSLRMSGAHKRKLEENKSRVNPCPQEIQSHDGDRRQAGET